MSSQRDYKKLYKQSKTENIKLKQTIEIMTQAGKEQVQMVEELRRAVADLKRRLGQHDNYNTPSSQKKGSRVSGTRKKGNDKSPETRERQKGHEDAAGN